MKIQGIEKTIKNLWELSKESFQNEDAQKELEKLSLFLNWDLRKNIVIEIIQTSNKSSENDYYSYYKIFDERGKYQFSLPFGRFQSLRLNTSLFEDLDPIIIKDSSDPSKSRNGGCYYEGYRIEKLKSKILEIYRVKYSWGLFSDFEEQCSDKPKLIYSIQELIELDQSNLILNK